MGDCQDFRIDVRFSKESMRLCKRPLRYTLLSFLRNANLCVRSTLREILSDQHSIFINAEYESWQHCLQVDQSKDYASRTFSNYNCIYVSVYGHYPRLTLSSFFDQLPAQPRSWLHAFVSIPQSLHLVLCTPTALALSVVHMLSEISICSTALLG